jgi:hypothetical protein
MQLLGLWYCSEIIGDIPSTLIRFQLTFKMKDCKIYGSQILITIEYLLGYLFR